MPLKTFVKAGTITNLTDARYCAGMGVDLLGFRVIAGQENYVTPKAFQEIRGWITGPQIVAEIYGIKSTQELADIIEQFQPDYLELGQEELNTVAAVITLPVILNLKPGENVSALAVKPAYVLIGEHAEHLEKIIPGYDVLVSVDTVDTVQQVLAQTGIAGIALHGTGEIRPGLKQPDELADILEFLDAE